MKKIFTLCMLLLCAVVGAKAEEAVLYYAGTTANSITVNGFTLAITGNTSKTWSNGNGDITISGTKYKTLKNSNGAQNTITCPTGKVATNIVFYVTTNADSAGKLSEFDGTACDDEVSSLKNYSNPTVIEKSIDNKKSFTFTFSAKQVCFIAVVTYENAVITSQELSGIKVGGTTLDDAKYSVTGTTITFVDNYSVAPTVSLVNKITYSDSSVNYADVNVELTKEGDFFQGTATIGETTYTVKAPVATDPILLLDNETITLLSSPGIRTATSTVMLTGQYLTGTSGTVTWAAVDGLTITPAEFTVTGGEVSQSFTISYNKDVETNGSVDVTFSDGTTNKVLTVNYKSIVAHTATTVSAATTWDWTSWNETLELKETTTLINTEQYVYSDFVEYCNLTAPSGFDTNTIAFKGQYPVRSKKSQAGTWIIKTTVPGSLSVTFSDTGSSGTNPAKRYLNINGSNTEFYTQRTGSSSDQKTVTVSFVPAGDIAITGMGEDGTTAQAICMYKIVFTPVTSTTVALTSAGYRTFASKYPTDWSTVSGVKAYYASAADGGKVTMTRVTGAVPAQTGLFLAGAEGSYDVPVVSDGTPLTDNLLVANMTTQNVAAGNYVFALQGGVLGFYKLTADTEMGSNKAYLKAGEYVSRMSIVFDDEATGIVAVGRDSSRQNQEVYNLSGQRVAKVQKGLYIVNGKKIVK